MVELYLRHCNMRLILFMLVLYIAPVFTLFGQKSFEGFEFFGNDSSIIECKIISDFKFLRKEKYKSAYQPAKFTLFTSEGDSTTINIKIKARGLFRRKHCLFPPFKIKFSKDDFVGSSVQEFNKLKLVTHCRSQPAYEQRVFEEYLIYKAYEMLTDYSLRVRMLRINYIDEGSKSDPGWNYAFLIEDPDQMAERNNAIEISIKNLHPEHTDRVVSTIMPVFQYMIGNTDWSVHAQHNIKLIKINHPSKYFPITVPYDFDYCGLLNAPYAVPPEKLAIENITERIYRGFCRTDEEFQKVFDLFLTHKEEILALFQNNELLTDKNKRICLEYLKEFFSIIENKKLGERTILSQCRTNS